MIVDDGQIDRPIGYPVSGMLEWIALAAAIESLGLAARDFGGGLPPTRLEYAE